MSIVQISQFTKKVIENIKKIPQGRVATYKQIAELSGKPQASRGVSWILHSCATVYQLPWHRVINSQGQISFEKQTHNYRKQKKLLEKEGVVFDHLEKINLNKFQWSKRPRQLKNKNRPRLFANK